MEASEINNMQVKDIRINKRKEVIVVELQEEDQENIEKILQITRLGQYQVRCYIPDRELYKIGVITPVNIDADLEEIKILIRDKFKVVDIERLKKKTNNTWVLSEYLKITFN